MGKPCTPTPPVCTIKQQLLSITRSPGTAGLFPSSPPGLHFNLTTMDSIIAPAQYQQFILAGKCEFVMHNRNKGTAVQYLVERTKDKLDPNVWFVKDRIRTTLLILIVHDKPFDISVKCQTFDLLRRKEHGRFDNITKQMVSVFEWFWHKEVIAGEHNKFFEIQHIGKCACCHRPLKDEISVTIGIGPDCRRKMGIKI